MSYDIAILGATGMVGREIITLLEERDFPTDNLYLYSSSKSAGDELKFRNERLEVRELNMNNMENCELCLSSLPRKVSKEFLPKIKSSFSGLIIDNSSAFRMDNDIPLVVPEVNGNRLNDNEKLIANPNCSTIQLVMILDVLQKQFGLKKIIANTYQSVSGSGAEALNALREESKKYLAGEKFDPEYYAHPIAFNLLPAIDYFHDDGFSQEEVKMRQESRKILELEALDINCTCVRVPIEIGHAESVFLELKSNFGLQDIYDSLSKASGIKIMDKPEEDIYPTPGHLVNTDKVLVGRIRKNRDNTKGLHLFIVANNIRKGAALNAVQIAERFFQEE